MDPAIQVARQALRAALALLDSLEKERAATEEPWYDSRSYPHGAKAFRRHIHDGMPAVRVGRGYRVRRVDAETYWAQLAKKPRTRRPRSASAADCLAAAGWRRTG
jgi:hypothetical protein